MNIRVSDSLLPGRGTRPDLDAVRQYWDEHPLFAGESRHKPGQKGFYKEHEQVLLYEHGGKIHPIFTRDVGPGKRVLDVGCGIGFWMDQFCRRGAAVSASDLSQAAVDLSRRRLKVFGLGADVRQGNAERLPYPDASFDHINCQAVIHYTPYPERCVEEFHRLLRPGGTLCFSVHFKVIFLRSRVLFKAVTALARPFIALHGRGRETMLHASSPEELVRLYDGADNPMARAFTRAELDAMLAGRFRVLEQRRNGLPRRALPFTVPDGVHRALSNAFGLEIVLRCRKV
ncbi:MAG: class I SAM-dependent methyltransferase [Pyrinomonadaceae bacterium]